MLRKSLKSVQNLLFSEEIKIEILIIDNDADASSKYVVEEIQANFPYKINYFVEEKRGISNARNKLLKEALNLGASHIAMFDDDEILDKNWLKSHFDYYNSNDEAFIISGPTYCKFAKKYPDYIQKNNIFKSSTTKKTGLIRNICASGNVFFPIDLVSKANIFFDNSHVFMGGEDGDFFSRAAKAGFVIVWNNDAINYEIIDDSRANIKWLMNRGYYNGYSGSFLKYKNTSSHLKRLIIAGKNSLILLLDCFLLLPSLCFGLTVFFNMLGMTCKTAGKVAFIIQNKPIDYYQNICGE